MALAASVHRRSGVPVPALAGLVVTRVSPTREVGGELSRRFPVRAAALFCVLNLVRPIHLGHLRLDFCVPRTSLLSVYLEFWRRHMPAIKSFSAFLFCVLRLFVLVAMRLSAKIFRFENTVQCIYSFVIASSCRRSYGKVGKSR